jgi:hypothetical protein
MSAWLTLPGAGVCTVVLLACVCRINLLHARRSKAGWIALYIVWAALASGVLIDLVVGRPVDGWAALGGLGALLHVVLTRRLWSQGAPRETERQRDAA